MSPAVHFLVEKKMRRRTQLLTSSLKSLVEGPRCLL